MTFPIFLCSAYRCSHFTRCASVMLDWDALYQNCARSFTIQRCRNGHGGRCATRAGSISRSSTVAAVKSRLHRARLELRARLQPLFGAEPEVARADACPDVLRALSERTEGDLDPGSCAELEQHVASCPRCTTRCDALRAVLAACAALPART